jgi:hypothetical protein
MATRNLNNIHDCGHVDTSWVTLPDGRIVKCVEGLTRFQIRDKQGQIVPGELEYELLDITTEDGRPLIRVNRY